MGDYTPIEIITDKLDEVSFSLHFHSRAHYISAHYYEHVDCLLTYIYAICAAVSAACGGASVVFPIIKNGSRNHTIIQVCFAVVTLVFILGSSAIKELQDTRHNPAEKTRLHNEAALEMKQLERKAALASLQITDNERKADKLYKSLLEEYREILANLSNIEKKIKSEDWAYNCVHFELAPSMKEKAIKHKKYVPKTISPCPSFSAELNEIAWSFVYFVIQSVMPISFVIWLAVVALMAIGYILVHATFRILSFASSILENLVKNFRASTISGRPPIR